MSSLKFPMLSLYKVYLINLNGTLRVLTLAGERHLPDECPGISYGKILKKKLISLEQRGVKLPRDIYYERGHSNRDYFDDKKTAPIASTIYNFRQDIFENKKLFPYINFINIDNRSSLDNIFTVTSSVIKSLLSKTNFIFNYKNLLFLNKLNSFKELEIIFDCFFDIDGIIKHLQKIEDGGEQTYAQKYPNLVDIFEIEKWIYNNCVTVENSDIFLKSVSELRELKNKYSEEMYKSICLSLEETRNYMKRKYKSYRFLDSPSETIQWLHKYRQFCLSIYARNPKLRERPEIKKVVENYSVFNIELLDVLKQINVITEIEYNTYEEKLMLLGNSFILISEFLFEFEFIIKFLNSDTRFVNLVAGSTHVKGISYFLERLKINANLTDKEIREKVSKRINYKTEKLDDCAYNNIDEITELF